MAKKGGNPKIYIPVLSLLFILLLVAPPMSASPNLIRDDELATLKSIRINLSLTSRVLLESEGSDFRTESLSVYLSLLPREGSCQSINSINLLHESGGELPLKLSVKNRRGDLIRGGGAIKYAMKEADSSLKMEMATDGLNADSIIGYGALADITSRRCGGRVTKKITFPFFDYPPEIAGYLNASGNIDSDNNLIKQRAYKIVRGKNDYYDVVSSIAGWVNENINYSLTTITSKTSQNASWVLINRRGVCDELTSLFIALLRSVNIPARFISGLSWSNVNGGRFQLHGWAEVYFPSYGWIPWDVTYDEQGFVDASHIILGEGYDALSSSTKFVWLGRDEDIKSYPLNINVSLIDKEEGGFLPLNISVEPYSASVGIGSYDLLRVKVSNPLPYYISERITIAGAKGMAVEGSPRRNIMVKPGGSIIRDFIVRFSGLKDYVYVFPIKLLTIRSGGSSANITVADSYPSYSLSQLTRVKTMDEAQSKKFLSGVDVRCSQSSTAYENESFNISCTLRNSGTVGIKNLSLCLYGLLGEENNPAPCKHNFLPIASEKTVVFRVKGDSSGVKSGRVFYNGESRTFDFMTNINDRPSVNISSLAFPADVEFNTPFHLRFRIEKTSRSSPRLLNVYIMRRGGKQSREWHFEGFNQSRNFDIELNSLSLRRGDNEIIIKAEFSDDKGRKSVVRRSADIHMGISAVEWPIYIVNTIFRRVDILYLKLLVVAAFSFGIVIGFILRGGGRINGKS